ncbi:MAG: hypothetical protein ACK4NB_06070, partial [Fimbriimonadales bacterium]
PESNPQLSPDGKTVYFEAERDGRTQIYTLTSDDPDEPRLRRARRHKIEPLTHTPEGASKPRLSPDGKWLAFQRGQGDLVVMHLETKREFTLSRSWNLGNIVWSPDSRWIAFDRYDENYNSDVFLVRAPELSDSNQTPSDSNPSSSDSNQTPSDSNQTPSDSNQSPSDEGFEVYNLSRHPRNDFAPSWSADGRALVFLSERETDALNICHVWLRREDFERTRADREDEEDDKHDAPKKSEAKDPVHVAIDWEDLHRRVRLVTRYAAGVREAVVAPDGEQIAFRSAYQGQADLYLIKWDGSDERRLTTGGVSPENLQFSKDGKTLYYLSRGRLQRVAIAGGSPQTTRTDAEITIDLAKEREYLYDAAWRTLNETFYDPNFHGVDWTAMRAKYRPFLPYAQSDRDFTAVVLMMLGELRSSHLSFSLARSESVDA